MRRLHNDDWGFASNCFVCEPRNSSGLGIAFAHDVDRDVVVASFTLGPAFSGAPKYVHGGVTLAILDEAMAWATIAIAGRFAMTSQTSTQFTGPVRVDEPHEVTASLHDVGDRHITASATVTDARGRVCAEANATFVVLSDAGLAAATTGQST